MSGDRGMAQSIGTAVLAITAALMSPQVESGPTEIQWALATPISAQRDARGPVPRRADFGSHPASAQARHIADWIADSQDHGDAEFIIIDKHDARLYVFDAKASLRATSPVLLGAARGDASVPGIGTRPIADVLPHERTTPAGRFVAERGHNSSGEDIVWIDYDAAVSMHRVRASNAKERRLQRLASPTVADNRISYGCINVPVAFYDSMVKPLFAARNAIVYVLPETTEASKLFNSYQVEAPRSARPDRTVGLRRSQ